MPVCTGGSEPKDGAPAVVALLGEGIAAALSIRFPWLGIAAGVASPFVFDVPTFCATEPPTVPSWTAADILALLSPIQSDAKTIAAAKLADTIGNVLWYQFCQCTVGGPQTPPAPTPAPTGTPVVNPIPRAPTTGGSYAAEVLADNPEIYWRFNERGGELVNNHGASNLRALLSRGAGTTVPTLGYSGPVSDGGSALLSGATWLGADVFPMFTGAFTLELWAWHPGRSTGGTSGPSVIIDSDVGNAVEYWGGGQFPGFRRGATVLTASALPSVGRWLHQVAVHTGTELRQYTDGVLIDAEPDSFSGQVRPDAEIGNTVDHMFLAELALYSGVLSTTRIQAHFDAADQRSARPVWQGSQVGLPTGIGGGDGSSAAILELVTLIQRQDVPFAYVDGTAHAGVSGTGLFNVSGILGLRVDFTTIPGYIGYMAGQPTTYFNVGTIALGDATGYSRREQLRHDPQLVLFDKASVYTRVGYTFPPGIVATITELVREP